MVTRRARARAGLAQPCCHGREPPLHASQLELAGRRLGFGRERRRPRHVVGLAAVEQRRRQLGSRHCREGPPATPVVQRPRGLQVLDRLVGSPAARGEDTEHEIDGAPERPTRPGSHLPAPRLQELVDATGCLDVADPCHGVAEQGELGAPADRTGPGLETVRSRALGKDTARVSRAVSLGMGQCQRGPDEHHRGRQCLDHRGGIAQAPLQPRRHHLGAEQVRGEA